MQRDLDTWGFRVFQVIFILVGLACAAMIVALAVKLVRWAFA